MHYVRAWDLAATQFDPAKSHEPDYTVGLLVGEHHGQFWVIDMQRGRWNPQALYQILRQTAAMDGRHVPIWFEQEPGSSGKIVIDDLQRHLLQGFSVYAFRSTGNKIDRAKPVSSAAEAGNIFLVHGAWNKDFLDEIVTLGLPGVHDDVADALSLAHYALTSQAPLKMW